jgi:DASS family divalent anion:Na+ symporter
VQLPEVATPRLQLVDNLRLAFKGPITLLVGLVLIAIVVAFWIPAPHALDEKQWRAAVFFLATILAVILRPFPLPVVVLFFLALGGTMHIFSEEEMLSGFSNGIVWIVLSSFFFARAYVKTGLGKRIALLLITKFGKSAIGLGYSLALTDLVFAPFTASNTARAGGIVFPIARSLALELGSRPTPTSKNLGGFLLFTAFQANVLTSSMFLTAMAVNPLTARLAMDGIGVRIGWETWFVAAVVPGALCLSVLPWAIHRWYPVEVKNTAYAVTYAKSELQKQGPVTKQEKLTILIFLIVAGTWATSTLNGIAAETAALLAVPILVIVRILETSDILGEIEGWSTFIWFGGMLSLANVVSKAGIAQHIVQPLTKHFGNLPGLVVLLGLCLAYFYLHYMFVSITAQILTMFPVFLSAAVIAGAPRLLATLCFCFLSSLYAATTYYGSGPAPIFFGSGYIERYTWLRVGFLVSILILLIWFTAGTAWWHLLGYW